MRFHHSTLHFSVSLSQKESSLVSLFRVLLMVRVLSWMFRRSVSSAKWNGEENLLELCKSFMYKKKMRKPRTNPCATPKLILSRIDEILSIQTYYILFVRFKPFISYFSNSGFWKDIMIICVKCFLRSIINSYASFLSNAFSILKIYNDMCHGKTLPKAKLV